MPRLPFFPKIHNPLECPCEQGREATYQNKQVLPGSGHSRVRDVGFCPGSAALPPYARSWLLEEGEDQFTPLQLPRKGVVNPTKLFQLKVLLKLIHAPKNIYIFFLKCIFQWNEEIPWVEEQARPSDPWTCALQQVGFSICAESNFNWSFPSDRAFRRNFSQVVSLMSKKVLIDPAAGTN